MCVYVCLYLYIFIVVDDINFAPIYVFLIETYISYANFYHGSFNPSPISVFWNFLQ